MITTKRTVKMLYAIDSFLDVIWLDQERSSLRARRQLCPWTLTSFSGQLDKSPHVPLVITSTKHKRTDLMTWLRDRFTSENVKHRYWINTACTVNSPGRFVFPCDEVILAKRLFSFFLFKLSRAEWIPRAKPEYSNEECLWRRNFIWSAAPRQLAVFSLRKLLYIFYKLLYSV